jgi:hypothetical protein
VDAIRDIDMITVERLMARNTFPSYPACLALMDGHDIGWPLDTTRRRIATLIGRYRTEYKWALLTCLLENPAHCDFDANWYWARLVLSWGVPVEERLLKRLVQNGLRGHELVLDLIASVGVILTPGETRPPVTSYGREHYDRMERTMALLDTMVIERVRRIMTAQARVSRALITTPRSGKTDSDRVQNWLARGAPWHFAQSLYPFICKQPPFSLEDIATERDRMANKRHEMLQ